MGDDTGIMLADALQKNCTLQSFRLPEWIARMAPLRIAHEIILRRNRELQAHRQILLQLAFWSDDNEFRSLKERYFRNVIFIFFFHVVADSFHWILLLVEGFCMPMRHQRWMQLLAYCKDDEHYEDEEKMGGLELITPTKEANNFFTKESSVSKAKLAAKDRERNDDANHRYLQDAKCRGSVCSLC